MYAACNGINEFRWTISRSAVSLRFLSRDSTTLAHNGKSRAA